MCRQCALGERAHPDIRDRAMARARCRYAALPDQVSACRYQYSGTLKVGQDVFGDLSRICHRVELVGGSGTIFRLTALQICAPVRVFYIPCRARGLLLTTDQSMSSCSQTMIVGIHRRCFAGVTSRLVMLDIEIR
jgi:hypothetical protein